LGIPVAISLETFVETEISCCAPRFQLILTAKFHSLYVKESEILQRSESGVGNFEKVGVGYFTSDSATLLISPMVNPALATNAVVSTISLSTGHFRSTAACNIQLSTPTTTKLKKYFPKTTNYTWACTLVTDNMY